MAALESNDIINGLVEAKVIPDLPLLRVVIDFKYNEPVKIYYECYGDSKTIDLAIEELIKGKDKVKIIEVEKEPANESGR